MIKQLGRLRNRFALIAILSIGLVSIPAIYAAGVLTIEDSISVPFEVDSHLFSLIGTDGTSTMLVDLECGNSGNPSRSLDTVMNVIDPNGANRFNDDGGAPNCGGFSGSRLLYGPGQAINGLWDARPRGFGSSTVTFTIE